MNGEAILPSVDALHELPPRRDRAKGRAIRRQRSNERAASTVDPTNVRDPLLHAPTKRRDWVAVVVLCLGASLAIHGAMSVLARLTGATPPVRRSDYTQAIQVQVVDPPKSAAPPPEVRVEPPAVVPLPKQEPLKKAEKVVEPEKVPPPDPVDTDGTPPKDPPREPPRRIVGISMESATVEGDAPAFATGNTRMGETSQVAEDPTKVQPLAPTFIAPRRTNAETPEYPATLHAQNIEGDVGLHVEIDASGQVTSVLVVHPSAHPEFDSAAKVAAAKSRYVPASVNGVAVARAIEFTVRFRLHS